MPKYRLKAVKSLMVGLIICALCALFSPRRETSTGEPAFRGFLPIRDNSWTHKVSYREKNERDGYIISGGTSYSRIKVEIDSGRLLGECIFVLSLAGIVSLVYLQQHLKWTSE